MEGEARQRKLDDVSVSQSEADQARSGLANQWWLSSPNLARQGGIRAPLPTFMVGSSRIGQPTNKYCQVTTPWTPPCSTSHPTRLDGLLWITFSLVRRMGLQATLIA